MTAKNRNASDDKSHNGWRVEKKKEESDDCCIGNDKIKAKMITTTKAVDKIRTMALRNW